MRNKSISVILKLFDSEQIKRLESFATSTYFNSKAEVSKLIEFYIQKKDADLSEFDAIQQAYKYLYKNSAYNPRKYKHLNERAVKLIEDFIVVESNLNDEVNYMTTLLSKYGEWHSVSEYEAVSHNLERFLATDLNIDHNFIQYLYQIFLIKNNYSNNEETKKYDELIKSTSEKLDRYYIQTKLRMAYEMFTRNIWRDDKMHPELLSEIFDIVERYDYRKEKYINMYCVVLKSVIEPNEIQHYYDLKDLLINHSTDFAEDKRIDLLSSASNYCALKINEGDQSFRVELFNLYKAVIEANVLLTKGELSAWLFTNIVTVAVTINELEWAEKFIIDYNKYVINQWSSTYYYNLSFLEFQKSNFDLAHTYILKIDEQDAFYQIRYKALLLRIYYEKREYPPLISLLESFKKFLSRNKGLNESQKQIYLSFIKFLNSLVLIPNGENAKLKLLRSKVEKNNIVSSKIWLLNCIDRKMR